jgi:hypothetical protein
VKRRKLRLTSECIRHISAGDLRVVMAGMDTEPCGTSIAAAQCMKAKT